jgi:hypothetical protein
VGCLLGPNAGPWKGGVLESLAAMVRLTVTGWRETEAVPSGDEQGSWAILNVRELRGLPRVLYNLSQGANPGIFLLPSLLFVLLSSPP